MLGIIGGINLNLEELPFNFNIIGEFRECVEEKEFVVKRNTNDKFSCDKVIFNNDEFFLMIDGVIFNLADLMKKEDTHEVCDCIIKLYKNNGDEFFSEFRGSFSGIFIEKKTKKTILFTDQVGDKKVYYRLEGNNILFSSRIKLLSEVLKNNNLSCEYDINSGYCMLTYGFMLENITPIIDVKRLMPGECIIIKSGEVYIKKYHVFKNEIKNISEDQAIEKLDELFRAAVKQQYDKDKEYRYDHISSISGGLDSRMTNFVSHEMGYRDVLNYTFSKNDYDDDKISKKIAADLKHEYIFKSLDDNKFIFNLDEMIEINGGTSIYYGMAHSKNLLEKINFKKYGMIHTGQLGDVIIGTFIKEINSKEIDITAGAYSKKLGDKLNELKPIIKYDNQELFMIYTRGFNGALSGNYAFQEFTESFSPFYNVEFMEYCLSLPLEYRKNHYIYYKWVLKKYPEASKYYYEKLKGKINENRILIYLRWLPIRILNKLSNIIFKRGIVGPNSPKGMNPFDYWYRTNPEFKSFVDRYYEDNISYIKNTEIRRLCEELFFKSTLLTEKFQVLTVIATNKMLYGNME